jgi:hypothetical protein
MKPTLLTKWTLNVIAATSFLLLVPTLVINTTVIDPVFAQDVDDDDNGDDVPVGGVEAGAGGAYGEGQNSVLPIVAAGGLALASAGMISYRRLHNKQR